jgi:hypothetical protein
LEAMPLVLRQVVDNPLASFKIFDKQRRTCRGASRRECITALNLLQNSAVPVGPVA